MRRSTILGAATAAALAAGSLAVGLAPALSHREAPKILADPDGRQHGRLRVHRAGRPRQPDGRRELDPAGGAGGRAVLRQARPRGPLLRQDRQHRRRKPDVAYRWEFDQRFRNPESFLDAARPSTRSTIRTSTSSRPTTSTARRTTARRSAREADRERRAGRAGQRRARRRSRTTTRSRLRPSAASPAAAARRSSALADDPFFVDLGAVFDGINIDKPGRPNIGLGNQGGGKDDVAGYNTHAFVLQVPEVAGHARRQGRSSGGRLERRRRRVGDHRAAADLRPPPRPREGATGSRSAGSATR